MKIFLFGQNGQVGSEVDALFKKNNIEVIAFPSTELDISNINSTNAKKEYFKAVDVVINAAAYTAVDKAEDEQEKAYAINQEGPKNLATICREFNIPLLHLSTDYVFSGNNEINHEETPIAPTSIYGKSKALGEKEIARQIENYINLRVSWVFGKNGNNFVKTILRLAKERDEIKVVDDQIGCPTPAADIARVLHNLSNSLHLKSSRGNYHYCGLEVVSWYEFTLKIIEVAKKHCSLKVKNIIPIKSHEYPSKVLRPKYSTLSCHKLKTDFGITQSSWVPYLEQVIQEILR